MRSRNPEMMRDIITFVDDFQMKHRRSPSTREIGEAMDIAHATAYRYLLEMHERGMIRYDGRRILTDRGEKEDAGVTRAALLGSVSCGIPLLEEEYVEAYISLPTAIFGQGTFFLLRANGDSMTGAGIDDGDLVIIRQAEEARDGEVVVALTDDGTTTLKRFFRDGDRDCVRLHPEHPGMEDILVRNCRIQGVAVRVLKTV